MDISKSNTTNAASHTDFKARNAKASPSHDVGTVQQNSSPEPKKIDFRNVSANEINSLIKAGEEGLLGRPLMIPPNIINEYGQEYAANYKVDFLSQIEGQIGFKKSLGEDTTHLEAFLNTLKEIDGSIIPGNVNITA